MKDNHSAIMPGSFKNVGLVEALVEHLPFGILFFDTNSELSFWNQKASGHWKIRLRTGMAFSRFTTGVKALQPHFPKGNQPVVLELKKILHRNQYLNIYFRRIPGGFMVASADVSREVAREQSTVNAMLDWQERERRRLSQEIHDGIGPLLSALKLSLEGMAAHVPDPTESFLKNYHNALDLLQTSTGELRQISHALMPGTLVDFGLVAALESLCEKANESGQVQVNFYRSGPAGRLGLTLERGLYRMAQELLNNAFKHAQAGTINIQLFRHPNSVLLMVEDDGIGLDKNQLQALTRKGIGLKNVQMRAQSFGGTFTLESQPGKGLLATVEIPVEGGGR